MILILLGTWLAYHFAGHSATPFSQPLEQAEALVKKHVADPTRQEQAVAILEQMEAIEKQRRTDQEGVAAALQKFADDRTAEPAQFMQLAESEHRKVVAIQAQLLDLRFNLKDQITAAEWKLVFPPAAAAP